MQVVELTVALKESSDPFQSMPTPPPMLNAIRRQMRKASKSHPAIVDNEDLRYGRLKLTRFVDNSFPLTDAEYIFFERLRTANWLLSPTVKIDRVRSQTPMRFSLANKYVGDRRFLNRFFDPPNAWWVTDY